LSENSREEEKLSFKEQILRDLERLKREEEVNATESGKDELFSDFSNLSKTDELVKEPSVEDLMNKRDRLLAFAALKSALENEDSYGSSVREISTDDLAEFALKLCFDRGGI